MLISSYRSSIYHKVSSCGTSSLSSVLLSVFIILMGCDFLVSLPIKYCWFFHQGICMTSSAISRCKYAPFGQQYSLLPSLLIFFLGCLVLQSNQCVISVPAASMSGWVQGDQILDCTSGVISQISSKKHTHRLLAVQC